MLPGLEIGGGLDLNGGSLWGHYVVGVPLHSGASRPDGAGHEKLGEITADIIHFEV